MTKPVVTRFAPSPTGFLHIGGARTALFCWLYARHTGGKFLLRIEDTDRARSTDAATSAILDGLAWLGLQWDDQTVFQSQRSARHTEIAQEILARGQGYLCYLSPAELEAMRGEAASRKDSVAIRSPWRDRDPKDAPPGVKPVIRLKVPRDGETVVDDKVQGRVVVQNKDLDDLIILRSDGSPIYNLAVVVDDHDMGVTHVIRGVDHLTNAAKQTLIYQAMGWDVPVFAHVPLIHGADGAKLSKRHGAQGVEEYRAMGYLPAGLRNYLARLGWSHGDDEIFSTEQMVEWFDIEDLNKSPARFDFVKLGDVNSHYIRAASPTELADTLRTTLPEMEGGPALAEGFARVGWDRLTLAIPSLQTRAKTLRDLAEGARYLLLERPIKPDEKAAKALDADAKATLAELVKAFSATPAWEGPALEGLVRAYSEQSGKKLGQVAQPLRAALTGSMVSPPIFDVMTALGRTETLARLADAAG